MICLFVMYAPNAYIIFRLVSVSGNLYGLCLLVGDCFSFNELEILLHLCNVVRLVRTLLVPF